MNELKTLLASVPLGKVSLPEAIKSLPAYHKFESTNTMLSDTVHGDEWIEQFSSYPKWEIPEDAGCIFTFRGVPMRQVGITTMGEVLGMEEVELRIEAAPGVPIPLFRQYTFYLHELEKTNGPELNANLRRSFEQQRAESEKGMTGAIAAAFAQIAALLANTQQGANAQEALKALIPPPPTLHPAQIEAQRIWQEMEEEDRLREAALAAEPVPSSLDLPAELKIEEAEEAEETEAPQAEGAESAAEIVAALTKKRRTSLVV